MNSYLELKYRHQNEIEEFPIGYAFDEDQFKDMMTRWGLTKYDTDKICSIGGGGYILKSSADINAYKELIMRHSNERRQAMSDNNGDYLYHMFNCELADHEYNYTGDLSDTLEYLGLTIDDIQSDQRMLTALNRAIRNQSEYGW